MSPAAAPSRPASSGADNDADGADLLQRTAISVLRTCDVLFGSATILMAVAAFVVVGYGAASLGTALAIAAVPAFNLAWSFVTVRRDRIRADLLRGVLCVPLTAYIYTAEQAGTLQRLWIPALLVCLGATLSVSIATRRAALGFVMSSVYGAALLGATAARTGTVPIDVVDDCMGIFLIGAIISLVASRFGSTIDEVGRQRDLARVETARAEETLGQLTDRTGELTVAIETIHDEMEHRARVEAELHQAQKLESVGRLASGIAHEINTPVQFVSDSIEFVRSAVGDLFELVHKLEVVQHSISQGMPLATAASEAAEASEAADLPYLTTQVPKALDLAAEGLGRVATIVRSMKEFSRPDSKVMVPTDLNRAVTSTLTMAKNEIKYVAELVTVLGDLPPIHCHVGELNQVVLNIVVNAAHAIGEVVADTDHRGTITVKTYRDGSDAVIEIADTGGGIPESIRGQVFDPFFTTKAVGRGTGQGLAIARSVIVDKHHGKLTFETETGRGTTFTIRIPIAGTAAPAAIAA